MELTKKDWEDVVKQAESMLHDAMLNVEIYKSTIEKAKKEIERFKLFEETGLVLSN